MAKHVLRCMITLLITVRLMTFGLQSVFANGICSGTHETLECLMENPKTLYYANMDQFWNILEEAALKAKDCSHPKSMAEFLNLIEIPRDGVFAEFFHEEVEGMFLNNTECVLEGVLFLCEASQVKIIRFLRNPLFAKKEEIDERFMSFKLNLRYKKFIDIYWEQTGSEGSSP